MFKIVECSEIVRREDKGAEGPRYNPGVENIVSSRGRSHTLIRVIHIN